MFADECYIERDESGTSEVHDAQEKLELLSTVDIIAIPTVSLCYSLQSLRTHSCQSGYVRNNNIWR